MPTLLDRTQYAGTVIAFVGTLVSAPEAVGQAGLEVIALARKVPVWLRRLFDWFRFWRRPVVAARSISGGGRGASFSGGGAVVTSGWLWLSGGPVEAQVQLLRQRTDQLLQRSERLAEGLRSAEEEIRQEGTERRADVAELRAQLKRLEDEADRREKRKTTVDARGLPIVGLGILLRRPEALG